MSQGSQPRILRNIDSMVSFWGNIPRREENNMKVSYAPFLLALAFVAAGAAQAQDSTGSGSADSRAFFPKGWIRGYVEGSVAPPHNEPDLNCCASWAGTDGGANAPCSAFARYVAGGHLEIQPLGGQMLGRVYFFWQPNMFLGRNVPQFSYSASAAPMAYEHEIGVGVGLPRSFELRLTHHSVSWLGRYNQYLGKADLGTNGPFGGYTTISVRWYFGSWQRPEGRAPGAR